MKKFFLLIVAIAVCATMWGADVIVLKNSTRIDAKILEVSDTEIKYRKTSNPDGPVFTTRVSEISAVIYENGDVQSFSAQQSAPVRQEQSVQSRRDANGTEEAGSQDGQRKSKGLKFNPQPSDHYWFGLTLGYVSKRVSDEEAKVGFFGFPETKFTPAMRFGMTINPMIKYGVGIRTGLFLEYARQNMKRDWISEFFEGSSYLGECYKVTSNDITLSIPLQVSYRYELIDGLSFMFYTGPVFDFGAFMNTVAKYDNDTQKTPNMYKKSLHGDKYRGFNCAWGIGAAIQWRRLRLDIGGEFGMVNKSNFYYFDDDYDDYGIGGTKTHWDKPVYVALTVLL
ncbi:MAG: hypothetical protein IJ756_09895 [Paludibacteraceae bacterium]|nr:hypothetical protein [Paludibacteraceae bacterium]